MTLAAVAAEYKARAATESACKATLVMCVALSLMVHNTHVRNLKFSTKKKDKAVTFRGQIKERSDLRFITKKADDQLTKSIRRLQ